MRAEPALEFNGKAEFHRDADRGTSCKGGLAELHRLLSNGDSAPAGCTRSGTKVNPRRPASDFFSRKSAGGVQIVTGVACVSSAYVITVTPFILLTQEGDWMGTFNKTTELEQCQRDAGNRRLAHYASFGRCAGLPSFRAARGRCEVGAARRLAGCFVSSGPVGWLRPGQLPDFMCVQSQARQ